jgi:hypothetical protein
MGIDAVIPYTSLFNPKNKRNESDENVFSRVIGKNFT